MDPIFFFFSFYPFGPGFLIFIFLDRFFFFYTFLDPVLPFWTIFFFTFLDPIQIGKKLKRNLFPIWIRSK